MTYRVDIASSAIREARESYLWIRQRSPIGAGRWFNRFMDAIDSLDTLPERCSVAPEAETLKQEIRQLSFGERSGVFRILFTVVGDQMRVLHILRGSRSFLEP